MTLKKKMCPNDIMEYIVKCQVKINHRFQVLWNSESNLEQMNNTLTSIIKEVLKNTSKTNYFLRLYWV